MSRFFSAGVIAEKSSKVAFSVDHFSIHNYNMTWQLQIATFRYFTEEEVTNRGRRPRSKV
jgi:hypothetical protein